MPANKTQATDASVAGYLAKIADSERRGDCEALVKMMTRVTGQKPAMWGASIVGFGSHHYKYDSGREGDICATGFSSREGDISIYLAAGIAGREKLLPKLGKHKAGKGCLYIRRLADVDAGVLEQLVAASVADLSR